MSRSSNRLFFSQQTRYLYTNNNSKIMYELTDRPLDEDGKPMFRRRHWERKWDWVKGEWKDILLLKLPKDIARQIERGRPFTQLEIDNRREYIEKYAELDHNWDEISTPYSEEEEAKYERYEIHCSACGGFAMYDERIVFRCTWGYTDMGKRPECPHCKRICTVHDIGP